jgi:hypothetical protein
LIRARVGGRRTAGLALALLLAASPAAAQPAAPDEADAGETTVTLGNVTRAEVWRYFEPPPSARSQPDYALLATRSTLAVGHREGRWRGRAGIQYVRVEPLPERAVGPGALGSGGLYQFHAQSSFSYQLYFRELSLGVEVAPGIDVEIGRLRLDGERPDAAVLAAPRQRLEGRLLGSFPWSMYERAFDGVRVDVSRPGWRATTMAAMPTQGTYEESANLPMPEIQVASSHVAFGHARHTQVFAYAYRDRRHVSVRPDNTQRAADRADVTIWTLGASHLGVADVRSGEIDTVVWAAAQAGRWYELAHRAWSAAAEAGHRWPHVPGRPWARAGVLVASGDGDARDDRHATFFPMLPSVDGRATSTVYAPMNLVDVFAQLVLEPHARLRVSSEVHRLSLATSDDRWYAGSGATMRRGAYFGYSSRSSGGETSLGTMMEASADVRLSRSWTARAYLGRMHGGDVVRHSFDGDRLTFFWVENVLRF